MPRQDSVPADGAEQEPEKPEQTDDVIHENGLTRSQMDAMLKGSDHEDEPDDPFGSHPSAHVSNPFDDDPWDWTTSTTDNPFESVKEETETPQIQKNPFDEVLRNTAAPRARTRALLGTGERQPKPAHREVRYLDSGTFWDLAKKDGVTAAEIGSLIDAHDASDVFYNVIEDAFPHYFEKNDVTVAQALPLMDALHAFFGKESSRFYTEKFLRETQKTVELLLAKQHRTQGGWGRTYKADDAEIAMAFVEHCAVPITQQMQQEAAKRLESLAEKRPDLIVTFAQTFSVDIGKVRSVALANIDKGTLFDDISRMENAELGIEQADVQEAALKGVLYSFYRADVAHARELQTKFSIPADAFRKAALEGLMEGIKFHITLDKFKQALAELGFSIQVRDPHIQESARIAFQVADTRDPAYAATIRDYFQMHLLDDAETRGTAFYQMAAAIQKPDVQKIRSLQSLYQMTDAFVQEILCTAIRDRYKGLQWNEREADTWCAVFQSNHLLSAEQIKDAKKDGWIECIATRSQINASVLEKRAKDLQTGDTFLLDATQAAEKARAWYSYHLAQGDLKSLDMIGRFCDFSALAREPESLSLARQGIYHLLAQSSAGTPAARALQQRYHVSESDYVSEVKNAILSAHENRWDERAESLASEYGMQDVRKSAEAKRRRIAMFCHNLHWMIYKNRERYHPEDFIQKEVARYIKMTRDIATADGFTDADLEQEIGNVLIKHLQYKENEHDEELGILESHRAYIRQILQEFSVPGVLLRQDVIDAGTAYVLQALTQSAFGLATDMMDCLHIDPPLEQCIPLLEKETALSLLMSVSTEERLSGFIKQKPLLDELKVQALPLLSVLSLTERKRILPFIFEMEKKDGKHIHTAFAELTALLIESPDPAAALQEIDRMFAGPYPLLCKVSLVYHALYPGKRLTLPIEQYDLPLLQDFHTVAPEKREQYIQLFLRISNSPSDEMRRVQEQLIHLILHTENPLDAVEKIEAVFVKNNIPLVGKIYRVFDILYPESELAARISGKSSPFLQRSKDKRRRVTIYRDLLKVHVQSANRNLRRFLEILQEGESRIRLLEKPDHEWTAIELQQAYYALMKFETLFQHSQTGEQSSYVPEKITSPLTDNDIRRRYYSLRRSLGMQEDETLHDKMVQMFAQPLGFSSVHDVLRAMRTAKEQAHERALQSIASRTFLTLDEGDLIKAVQEHYIGFILQNGSVAVEFLGASSGSDSTPLDTDLSRVTAEDAQGGFNTALSQSIGYNETYGNILFVLKNRGQWQMTTKETQTYDPDKYELFNTPVLGPERHYGIRTGFPSTEIDYMIASEKLSPKDRGNLFFEIAKNGFYIPVVDTEGAIVFTPEMYSTLRKTFDGLERFDGDPLEISTDTSERHAQDIEQATQEVRAQRVETHRQMTHIESIVSSVLSEYGTSLKSVYDTSLGGVRLEDTGSTGRGTQLSGSSDFDFALKLDSSSGDTSLFAASAEIAEKILKRLQPETHRVEQASGTVQLRAFHCSSCDGVDVDIAFIPTSDIADFGSHNAVTEKLEWIRTYRGQAEYDTAIANIVLAKKLLKGAGAYKKVEDGGIGGIGVENWVLAHGCNVLSAFRSFLQVAVDANGVTMPLDAFKKTYAILDPGVNVRFDSQGENFLYPLTEKGYAAMIQVITSYLGAH